MDALRVRILRRWFNVNFSHAMEPADQWIVNLDDGAILVRSDGEESDRQRRLLASISATGQYLQGGLRSGRGEVPGRFISTHQLPQMLFRQVNGTPEPSFPFAVGNVVLEADGRDLLSLEQAVEVSGISADVLAEKFDSAFSSFLAADVHDWGREHAG